MKIDKDLIPIILVLLLVIGGIYWSLLQYKECKEMNFSTLYCIHHAL